MAHDKPIWVIYSTFNIDRRQADLDDEAQAIVAILESGPADSATKDATEIICTKEEKVVPPPRVELGTC
jgi:hypothetical protein